MPGRLFPEDDLVRGVTLDFETVYSQARAPTTGIVNSYDGTFSYDALKSLDLAMPTFAAFAREQGNLRNMRETFLRVCPCSSRWSWKIDHAFIPTLLRLQTGLITSD